MPGQLSQGWPERREGAKEGTMSLKPFGAFIICLDFFIVLTAVAHFVGGESWADATALSAVVTVALFIFFGLLWLGVICMFNR